MTGVAVIEQRNSIPFQSIAIENMAVETVSVNSEQKDFNLDSKKIREIQKSLKELGLYKGKNSGRLNQNLKKGLRLFQTNNGFEDTGIITEEVYNKLVSIGYPETQPILNFEEAITEEQITEESNKDFFHSNYTFANLATYTIHQSQSPIHISQQPRAKSKQDLYFLNGKDDFLFIGVFLILVAVTIVAAFFVV